MDPVDDFHATAENPLSSGMNDNVACRSRILNSLGKNIPPRCRAISFHHFSCSGCIHSTLAIGLKIFAMTCPRIVRHSSKALDSV
jgi:hypothetical protein